MSDIDASPTASGPAENPCLSLRRRQVASAFGKSTLKAGTDISALTRRNLGAGGRTDDTAFTDGCPGLRSVLVDAGVTNPPILDWFHIVMQFQHAAQSAIGLSTGDPA